MLFKTTDRMFRRMKCAIALGAVFVSGTSAVAEDMTAYQWRASISGDLTTGLLHKILLAPEMADRMKSFPLDVRVVDEGGISWPAMIWAYESSGLVDPVPSTRSGASTATNEVAFTRISLATKSLRPGDAPPAHNRIIVSLGGSEFRRTVEVWTGDEPDQLKMQAREQVVEQATPVAIRKRTIDYPVTVDRFVEARIDQDAIRPEAPLTVRAVELAHVDEDPGAAIQVEAQMLDVPEGERISGDPVPLHLDSGVRHLPLVYLELEIETTGYFPARIRGRHDPAGEWRQVADGIFLNQKSTDRPRITFDPSPFRYLQVQLYPDGQVLPRIKRAFAGLRAHYLVFKPLTDRMAYLYVGAARYQLPAAAFVRSVDRDSVQDAPEASLSRLQENPAKVVHSLHQYWDMLFKAGGLLAALLVMVFFARKLRDRLLS